MHRAGKSSLIAAGHSFKKKKKSEKNAWGRKKSGESHQQAGHFCEPSRFQS